MESGIKKLIKMISKKFTSFRPEIRTRHNSHSQLRRRYKKLPLMPFKSVVRLGSPTELKDDISSGGTRIELNTVKAIRNSSNKRLMKDLFTKNEVPTPMWQYLENIISPTTEDTQVFFNAEVFGYDDSTMDFPVIVKAKFGSRGKGNTKIGSVEEFITFLKGVKDTKDYIIEKFYNYSREYRVHVNSEGGFYFLRKMLKSETPDDKRWFRNDSNSVWIMEENPLFDKPTNIDAIEEAGVKALNAMGLDFGAIDVKVQSSTTTKGTPRKNAPLFTIIEINSAPSFGDITLQKYVEEIPKMLTRKYKNK